MEVKMSEIYGKNSDEIPNNLNYSGCFYVKITPNGIPENNNARVP